MIPIPNSLDVEELRNLFKEHGSLGGFGFQDFPAGEDLKDVVCDSLSSDWHVDECSI